MFTARQHADDAENLRVIETNGAKIFLHRTDPFGFWIVQFEKGQLPESLTGSYTSATIAAEAVEKYLNDHKTREKKAA